ncbi:thiamine diphosphokinase [Caldibacillus thermolactis]|jgi:thiamine pyrophosphokinase|uniref:Thiamine diphosphokinase n=1 Tax=Pallidibacillus thermolactis TaxID=251051 RepID=A0ABT2WBT6_9BACI|nr:thiamine diphosphokinase [Pallidibacillus thermolactis]MCU9593134.1 thiamine diphosphokinase [Pallidibacillus thermolactis]MED1672161.1 thiamine diphosphokinase [Pallidibacillus thermolactis subsp. kokeshiiformis]
MIIHIVAGGPKEYIPDLSIYKEDKNIKWIAVDRGALYLQEFSITPDEAIGDFDSMTEEELEQLRNSGLKLDQFQEEKDETDMELALHLAFEYHPEAIQIFGATGGRIDHFMANISLLYQALQSNRNIPITIIDKQNMAYMTKPGTYTIEKMVDKKYISFIPITKDVENLTLKGFKYPLENRHIFFGSTLCISNELILNHGTYSFSKGILLVIRSSDK